MFKEWLRSNKLSSEMLMGEVLPRACCRSAWTESDFDYFTKEAEKLENFDWPTIKATDFMEFSRTGNRLIMEDKHFARRYAFLTLVTAEVCEYKGRFTDGIINGLMAICEESFWGVSAHYKSETRMIPDAIHPYIDLFAAETGAAVAVCIHMLGAELSEVTPDILRRAKYELNRRIVEPFLSHEDFGWMGYGGKVVANWNPWILSNILTVALLTADDGVTKTELVKKIMLLADNYMKHVPKDGGCDEGPSYWDRAGTCVFDIIYQLYLASNGSINFFDDPIIYKIGDYLCKVYIGDGWVANYADCPVNVPKPGFGTGMIYLFGKMTGNKTLMGIGSEFSGHALQRAGSLRRTLMSLCSPAMPCEYTLDRYSVLPTLEISTSRTKEYTAIIKGGWNSDCHNHNDVGSFIIFGKDNTPILIDAGVGDYTRQTFSSERYSIWTMQSSYHNLPEVNGAMQHDGAQYRAEDFVSENGITSMDIAKAYENGSGLIHLYRCFEAADTYVKLTDNFQFEEKSNSITENFIFAIEPTVCANKILIGEYEMSIPEGLSAEIDSKDIKDNRKLYGAWKRDTLWRLRLSGNVGQEAELIFTVKRR